MIPKSGEEIDESFMKKYKKQIEFVNMCHKYIKNLPDFFENVSEPEIITSEDYEDQDEETFFYEFSFDSIHTDTEYLLECLLVVKSYNLIDLTNGIDGHFYNFNEFKSILEEWEDIDFEYVN